ERGGVQAPVRHSARPRAQRAADLAGRPLDRRTRGRVDFAPPRLCATGQREPVRGRGDLRGARAVIRALADPDGRGLTLDDEEVVRPDQRAVLVRAPLAEPRIDVPAVVAANQAALLLVPLPCLLEAVVRLERPDAQNFAAADVQ